MESAAVMKPSNHHPAHVVTMWSIITFPKSQESSSVVDLSLIFQQNRFVVLGFYFPRKNTLSVVEMVSCKMMVLVISIYFVTNLHAGPQYASVQLKLNTHYLTLHNPTQCDCDDLVSWWYCHMHDWLSTLQDWLEPILTRFHSGIEKLFFAWCTTGYARLVKLLQHYHCCRHHVGNLSC